MRIFVDSSIILAFLAGQDERAYRIVEEIENHAIIGYINAVVVDEVVHGYLRLATGLSSKRIRQLLAKRDRRLVELVKSDVEPLLKLFITLPIVLEPHEIIEAMEEYGLMPADAVIALTCKHYGIYTIAALDDDFRRIPWLKVIP
ncbi:PilT protein domain protein [Pyrolobus fumarii 1A]|uniref:PilT protein domain protein n=1 Tax=Pyrolobus fumarii (strain DSM 11204 / 1A) TaxID=694429 RepID=G0EG74_PYRF1|nr:type II toxin-antitoxin system VapC family toxin [Pyrolobus fumarii]AEM38322.1 PilT protein domain protein [Pyrolobus fumarii 1A]